MTRTPRSALTAVLCLGAVVAVAACAPTAGGSSPARAVPAVSTTPGDEPVRLTLTHFEDGGLSEAVERLVQEYESLHPNVSVDLRYTNWVEYGQQIAATLAAPDAPDLVQVGQGHVMQGPLVAADLLLPLDDYAQAYRWEQRFQAGLLDQSRVQEDGASFGDGKLYGVALGGNLVGIYYDKALVARLGIPLPVTSLAELEAALAVAARAGLQPIALGNAEGWPAGHVLSSLMTQYQRDDEVLSWIYGRPGADFAAAGAPEALATVQRWVDAGWISPSANATSLDDAVAGFLDGRALFLLSGSWSAASVDDGLSEAGFMLVPPARAGAPRRATGATTSPFGIARASEHPDVAAHLLDFLLSDGALDDLVEGGYVPVTRDGLARAAGITGARADVNRAYAEVLADNGLTLYLDWSTATMGDTLFPALQEVLEGERTPQELIGAVQSDWERWHPS